MQTLRLLSLLLALSLLWQPAQAQRFPLQNPSQPARAGNVPVDRDGAEFHFARLIYGDRGFGGGGFRGRGRWTTDWPEAEHFFMQGITRLTRVDGREVSVYNGDGGERVSLTDGNVFDYPFLYAVEVGYWSLTQEEIAILREYLLRGGFLIVDDFHGTEEWGGFISVMQRVFPDRPIVDIPEDAEVFHVLYDLDEKVQIPGLAALYSGVTYERDGYDPHWRGIFDDSGRLLVAINHNMDLGDAWEHADTPGYPEPMTALAYRFAVNYVIYAMTH
ncbi:MAG TPA: DUF4159 domain-containing protein [Hyphomicrobiales bacterium]|nr:DUF4159 domain-containing protein [Hyphomicrobiales bacterium]